ncbi:hypothetical protein ATANTOWER_002214 [Ataeniobius toweri]|uniref:Uncharacterized protein n=1 Tax=Ataeniobius toweri TaxID=208326 RepID=A0ABU7BZI1_9TELE|nr:hypothetical protein [Ataeniobius toweri]
MFAGGQKYEGIKGHWTKCFKKSKILDQLDHIQRTKHESPQNKLHKHISVQNNHRQCNQYETGAEETMFQKQFYAITVNGTFMHSIENNARPFKKHRLTVSPDIATLNVKCMQKHPTYLYR